MHNGCPRCANALSEHAFGSIAIDGCNSCGGLWFDYQELNRLVRDPQQGLMDVERAFNPALFASGAGGDMKCPKCADSSLYKFSFPHTPNVELDACPTCKGIWVDDGELQKIAVRIASSRSGPAVPIRQDEVQREQHRTVTSFLLSAPCAKCGLTNPAAAAACWQCGAPLKTRSVYRICPTCDCPLTEEATPAGTRIDACLRCGGVWFEAGEMSVLFQLGPQVITDIQRRLMAGRAGASGRGTLIFMAAKCPGCHYLMERKSFAGVDDLKIDVCSNCKGVWLDGGELGRAYALFTSGAKLQATAAPADPWGASD